MFHCLESTAQTKQIDLKWCCAKDSTKKKKIRISGNIVSVPKEYLSPNLVVQLFIYLFLFSLKFPLQLRHLFSPSLKLRSARSSLVVTQVDSSHHPKTPESKERMWAGFWRNGTCRHLVAATANAECHSLQTRRSKTAWKQNIFQVRNFFFFSIRNLDFWRWSRIWSTLNDAMDGPSWHALYSWQLVCLKVTWTLVQNIEMGNVKH